MSSFIRSGDEISVYSDSQVSIKHSLEPLTYMVCFHPLKGFYLRETNEFQVPKKIYGNFKTIAWRIIKTFKDRPGSTGVLLSGLKGTGKTLLAKLVSNDMLKGGYPTIIVQSNFGSADFMKFIQDIDTPCVVVFDEFEKVYTVNPKKDSGDNGIASQDALLTMLDGVYSSKKLFIMTCNDEDKVTKFLFNRPGRIFYNIRFDELPKSFISEYVADTLVNKDHVNGLVSKCSKIMGINFDMVQALVEEMNRYEIPADEAIQLMNIRPDKSDVFSELDVVSLSLNGRKIKPDTKRIMPRPQFYLYTQDKDEEGDRTVVYFDEDDSVDSEDSFIRYKNEEGYELVLRKSQLNHSAYFWE